MTIDPMLIERIYEAAALPERWPAVLEEIAAQAGSKGAVFVVEEASGPSWVASPRMERDVADYFAAGWTMPDIAGGLMAAGHPGFQSETDFQSPEQIARMPVHAEFFNPRGYAAGAGTVLQGAHDDALMCVLEGFADHDAARAAVPWLDNLRAPLGRAFSLTARLRDAKADGAVRALDVAGVGAAIVSPEGQVRAANDRFTQRLGDRIVEYRSNLRFTDGMIQRRFAGALATSALDASAGSFAIAAKDDQPALAIHLVPLRRGAREVFGWDGVLLLLAEPANASVPQADLLRLLFDLTPAEARLTRHLLEGLTPAGAARAMRITEATARVHLRRVFAKTGVTRQVELVQLLLGLGGPR